jgi:hypothetical protein
MKITKAIFLSFANTTNATTSISVPFKVKTIHVKGIGYTSGSQPAAGAAIYGVITSDLTDYQPLGIFYNDVTYSYATNKDIVLTLYSPRTISGSYTFTLLNEDGASYTPVGGGTDKCTIILEFNDETELHY